MLFRFSLYGFLKNQRYFEPFIVLILLDSGLSFFWIGLLIAIRELTVNVVEIPSGAVADLFGRRMSMIVSMLAYVVSFLFLGTASSWSVFAVGMVLFGIGDAFRTGTHKSMIFQWLRLQNRTDERTRVYGFTRSWSKFGSAASVLIAALIVLLTDSYRLVFFLAIVPYLINVLNLATYPKELDVERSGTDENNSGLPPRTPVSDIWRITRDAWSHSEVRKLVAESMGWEGIFHAVKDYLQPVVQTLAVVLLASWLSKLELSDVQSTAILTGLVFFFLHFASGIASRSSHRFVEFAGSVNRATTLLWTINFAAFALLAIAAYYRLLAALIGLFMFLYVMQNIWRPILITRFDQCSNADQGVTVLSIESQAQRLATMFVAPMIGWAIDYVQRNELGGQFWPIGLLGAGVSLWFVILTRKLTAIPQKVT